MALFIGSEEEFNTYFKGFAKNKVNYITSKERRKCNGTCEYCSQISELQSAHKTKSDRKTIISNLLKSYPKRIVGYKVDLKKFEEDFIEAHQPIREHFYFLCQVCHKKYDKGIINDIDIVRP
jgi:5-methylcytosine-specific restriction endonuclease McrA